MYVHKRKKCITTNNRGGGSFTMVTEFTIEEYHLILAKEIAMTSIS